MAEGSILVAGVRDWNVARWVIVSLGTISLLYTHLVIANTPMDLKGKQVKNYILGDTTLSQHNMHLLAGTTTDNRPVSILMIDKHQLEQQSFVAYINMLQ